MPYLILHLSDIHITASPENNPMLGRADSIAAAASSISADPTPIFVVFSGDVVFSGKKEEFALFEKFVHELLTAINLRLPNSPTYTFIVPGNHDCDFESHDSLREMVLSQIGSRSFD